MSSHGLRPSSHRFGQRETTILIYESWPNSPRANIQLTQLMIYSAYRTDGSYNLKAFILSQNKLLK